jgi:ABC-type glycerol-3-phosphate transport system substrate-binding protein
MLSMVPSRPFRSVAGRVILATGRWTVCAVLLLAMIGCGGKTPAPSPVSPLQIESPLPTVSPTPTPEIQPMIVTLQLWLPEELDPYGDAPGADVLVQQLDDFGAAYPDVQVEVVVKKAHGRGGLLDFLRTARDAAPSVMPDLLVLDVAELGAATDLGLLQPLDSLLAAAEMAERFPFASKLGTVSDQTMGFVIGADLEHLVYRPALLASPPVSWTQHISPPVSFLFPAAGRDRQVNDATLIQYLAAGGSLTDDAGNPALDEDVMVSVLGFYSDCVSAATFSPVVSPVVTVTVMPPVTTTGLLTTSLGISPTVPLTALVTITPPVVLPPVSMIISPNVVLNTRDGDHAWERFRQGEGDIAVVRAGRYWLEADETFAPALIPTQDGRPFSIARRAWAVAVVADDPARQSVVMLLLNWLFSPDHTGEWTQASGYLPATRSALRYWSVSSADRAVLRGVLDAAVPAPDPGLTEVVGPPMQDALRAVLRGRDSPEEAAATAVQSLAEQ